MFRDKIIELQLSATDVAVIQNYGSVVGWTLSLFGGVLIKRCGCRTAAFVSCLFAAPGILWSAHVSSYSHFIMSYTILQCNECFVIFKNIAKPHLKKKIPQLSLQPLALLSDV